MTTDLGATTCLPTLVTAFFITHLGAERNVSRHTILAYRDGLKLLFRFATGFYGRQVCRLHIEDLDRELVLGFLTHLETDRKNSIRTRNARLAAIHCFFRFALDREPVLASLCQKILAIPFKKARHPELGYLNEEELTHILSRINRSSPIGERDYVLMALLYDTGTRIQELLDLKPRDFHLASPAFVRVFGKGRKERLCPLLPQTARLVERFIAENHRRPGDAVIFRNRRGHPLTRHGARYLLRKYRSDAEATMPSLGRPGISPHTLRHTKAMHLLQSGVSLVSIKDILGHAQLKSTEIYVQTDLEGKRQAFERAGTPAESRVKPALKPDLLAWLETL